MRSHLCIWLAVLLALNISHAAQNLGNDTKFPFSQRKVQHASIYSDPDAQFEYENMVTARNDMLQYAARAANDYRSFFFEGNIRSGIFMYHKTIRKALHYFHEELFQVAKLRVPNLFHENMQRTPYQARLVGEILQTWYDSHQMKP